MEPVREYDRAEKVKLSKDRSKKFTYQILTFYVLQVKGKICEDQSFISESKNGNTPLPLLASILIAEVDA